MKFSTLFIVALLAMSYTLRAQYYDDVLSYATNGTPTYGVKIKTNLPFQNLANMPSLEIIGYAYGSNEAIQLSLNYYINNNTFVKAILSTQGAFNPRIKAAGEGGKVVFLIDSIMTGIRFHIRAYSKGNSQDLAANFTGWTAVDSLLLPDAVAVKTIPYLNKFPGNVVISDTVMAIGTNKFGIGTMTPKVPLDITMTNSTDSITCALARNSAGSGGGSGTILGVKNYGTINGGITFGFAQLYGGAQLGSMRATRIAGANAGTLWTWNAADNGELMRFDNTGKLCVGCTNPEEYKLAVNGDVKVKKLQVAPTGWADFVFAKDYQLPGLQSIKDYILQNGHLPGVPTEKDVLANGIEVGEMNKILTQKIEELTLHLINKEQQINELTKRLSDIECKLQSLK